MALIRPTTSAAPPTHLLHPVAIKSAGSSAMKDSRMRVELTDAKYTTATATLALIHVACAAFLIANGRLYWYLEHPYLAHYANLLAPASDRHFRLIGTLLACVGLLHVLQLSDLARSTWRSRQGPMPVAPKVLQVSSQLLTQASLPSRTASAKLAAERVASEVDRVFGRKSLLGVDSARFEQVFIGRELTEIAFQVYQAYRSSLLINRVWINHCYAAIVVVNCWSTPLLQKRLRHSPAAQRAACLAIDCALNMCLSIVLPTVTFIPYLAQYNVKTFSFETVFAYNDMFFDSLIFENQSIFAVSLLDCASKLVPHLSVFAGLRAVGSLLERKAAPQASKKHARNGPANLMVQSRESRAHKLLHVLFVVFGLSILSFHVTAITRHYGVAEPGCKQTMHPWFATKYACSVYNFNCYRHDESPSLYPNSLDFLDESTLTILLITHCPALVVPQAIQNFPNLLGLEFYNSTIVEWSKEASISKSIHQKLTYTILFRVNMTKLPDGMLQPLPNMLRDFEIVVSNLTTLPDDLHERWRSLSVLYLEYTQLETVPETLLQLEVNEFSLIGNQFETLPNWLSMQSSYHKLALSLNPLRMLPASVRNGLTIDILQLENTDIQELPDWVRASVQDVVYLSGSPVCESQLEIKSSARLLCSEKDPRGSGLYPQAVVIPQRQL